MKNNVRYSVLIILAVVIMTLAGSLYVVDQTEQVIVLQFGEPVRVVKEPGLKAKIPFLSQTLSPSVDTLGRDIQKYGGNNNIFNVFRAVDLVFHGGL